MNQKSTRALNTIDAVVLTIGSMVGAGIFTILSLTVRTAGPLAVAAWVCIVVLSFPLALSFSDLTGVLAESGGPYIYVKHRTRPWIGLWVAWSFLLSSVGAAGALFIALIGMLEESHVVHGMVWGIVILSVLAIITSKGIHLGALVQRVLTLTTVILLVGATLIGIFHATWLPDMVSHPDLRHVKITSVVAPHGWLALLPATFYAFWTYSGWEAVAVPSGSYTSNKALGRGMLIGSVLVGLMYICVALGTTLSIPSDVISSHVNPLVYVGKLMGPAAATVISWGALLVVTGSLLSWLIASASLLQSLCRDGLIPGPKSVRESTGAYHPFIPCLVAVILIVMAFLPIFSYAIAASSLMALVPYAVVFGIVAMDKRATWDGTFKSSRQRRIVATLAFFVSLVLISFSGWSNLWPTVVLLSVGGAILLIRKLKIGTAHQERKQRLYS